MLPAVQASLGSFIALGSIPVIFSQSIMFLRKNRFSNEKFFSGLLGEAYSRLLLVLLNRTSMLAQLSTDASMQSIVGLSKPEMVRKAWETFKSKYKIAQCCKHLGTLWGHIIAWFVSLLRKYLVCKQFQSYEPFFGNPFAYNWTSLLIQGIRLEFH